MADIQRFAGEFVVQTKHLFFLVFVSAVIGLYSYHNIGVIDNPTTSQKRGPSSESGATEVALLNEEIDEADVAISIHETIQNENPYTSICKLPPEMVNPTIYERYCRNKACLRVNESCSNNNRCCSGLCVKNKCVASSEHKLLPGEICNEARDCYSSICLPSTINSKMKICYGDNTTLYCTRVTQPCLDNRHCCSGKCYKNTCIASSRELGQLGAPCADHNQCVSRYCSVRTNTCE